MMSDWKSCLGPLVLYDLLIIMFHTNNNPSHDPSPEIHLCHVSERWVRRPEQTSYGARLLADDQKRHMNPILELDPDYLEKQ